MPQRLKGLIGNTYQSWKVSRRYPLGEGRGDSIKLDTGRLNPEVQPLTLLYAVFERRRYPLRAEPLRIGHYGEYPPGKTKNWQRVPPLLFVPKTFSFIVKLKRTLETFPFVHFSRKYFYAPAHTRKRKRTAVQINIHVDVDKSGRT